MHRAFAFCLLALTGLALSPASASPRCLDELDALQRRVDAVQRTLARLDRCEGVRRAARLFRAAAALSERCMRNRAGGRLARQYREDARRAIDEANAPPDRCGLR